MISRPNFFTRGEEDIFESKNPPFESIPLEFNNVTYGTNIPSILFYRRIRDTAEIFIQCDIVVQANAQTISSPTALPEIIYPRIETQAPVLADLSGTSRVVGLEINTNGLILSSVQGTFIEDDEYILRTPIIKYPTLRM